VHVLDQPDSQRLVADRRSRPRSAAAARLGASAGERITKRSGTPNLAGPVGHADLTNSAAI